MIPFDRTQTYFFGFGRVALLEGLKVLGIKSGDNVLVPSYICNVVLAPFNYLGIKVKYFEVSEELQPRLNQIESQIDNKTKAILAVNYFGFPTLLKEIKEICQKKNLFFIEDNAHGFLSKLNNEYLGTFGDISIFSMRKTLALPMGAALVINDDSLKYKAGALKLRKGGDFISFLKQLNRNLELLTGFNPVRDFKKLLGIKKVRFPEEESPEEERNIEKYFVKFSRMADWILKRIDSQKIVQIRKEGFNYWLKHLPEGEPIFKKLSEGIVPYVFPVRTKDRDGFIKRMLAEGIECFPWPTLPSGLKDCPQFYKEIVCISLGRDYGSPGN